MILGCNCFFSNLEFFVLTVFKSSKISGGVNIKHKH